MASVLVPLAQGCEELEAITVIDLLRRAGIEVITAGLDNRVVTASRGTKLVPDTDLDSALERDFDMIVLPGGLPGADNLDNDNRIHPLLRSMADSGKFIAAICAAPKILANAGLLNGKKATSYPGHLGNMDLPHTQISNKSIEIDGTIVTSRGPGTAMDFALVLVELLAGLEKRKEVETALVRS